MPIHPVQNPGEANIVYTLDWDITISSFHI